MLFVRRSLPGGAQVRLQRGDRLIGKSDGEKVVFRAFRQVDPMDIGDTEGNGKVPFDVPVGDGVVLFGAGLHAVVVIEGEHVIRNDLVGSRAHQAFEDGADVTVEALLEKGIIRDAKDGVKVLGNGELTKKLNVAVNAYSASAKAKIEELGGKAEVI